MGPGLRRGIADFNGKGEIVTGWVVMRYGANPLAVIKGVKAKMAEIQRVFPKGVVFVDGYDRSGLIEAAIRTLRGKLIEESIIVALVTILFLFHAQSALVAIVTLPIGLLMAFLAMRVLGLSANIMSLGGIAIAIGAMIDAAIVMVENLHKHMERNEREGAPRTHWELVVDSSKEVGPSLFISLLIITVSFLPVFALEAQEGRLFKPLAWTKTLVDGRGVAALDHARARDDGTVHSRRRAEGIGEPGQSIPDPRVPTGDCVSCSRHRWPTIAVARRRLDRHDPSPGHDSGASSCRR